MQDMVHIRHILHRCFSMANDLRQYVMWIMNAVNTLNTYVKWYFAKKKGQMLRYVTRVNEWRFANTSVCDIAIMLVFELRRFFTDNFSLIN